ncbi:MAG: energy transducer TonB [Acidobacteriota bacterium]
MRWSMLPVSIGVHATLGVAVLIAPLGADEWPVPPPLSAPYVAMNATPIARAAAPRAVGHPAAISATAPAAIEPEREAVEIAEPSTPGLPDAIPFSTIGMPGGLGTPTTIAAPPPPPPPPTPSIVRAGEGVREPKKIADVRPVYPAIAQSARVQGTVILEAVINERGAVERINVLRSIPLLDGAAISAVRAWRYTPTTLNGVAVSVLITITINFTLHE